jgi:hypothetical protein
LNLRARALWSFLGSQVVPIEYRIDHERRLVTARGYGIFSDEDVFRYQSEVWSRLGVVGYEELVDVSQVERIELPSPERVKELAKFSARMDPRSSSSRLAVVAPSEFAFGLARMYEAYRNLDDRSTKMVSVFRSMDEALAFLGISDMVKESES